MKVSSKITKKAVHGTSAGWIHVQVDNCPEVPYLYLRNEEALGGKFMAWQTCARGASALATTLKELRKELERLTLGRALGILYDPHTGEIEK